MRTTTRAKRGISHRGTEGEAVGAFGQLHDSLILSAFGGVVLSEFGPQAPSLDSHHGIYVGIEVLLASENLGCDLIFLRIGSGMLQGLSCQIAEQLAKRLRSMQGMATEKFFELLE